MSKYSKPMLAIIDDEQDTLDSYYDFFKEYFEIKTSDNVSDGIEMLKRMEPDVAIIDMWFGRDEEGGLKILKAINENRLKTKPIILTAHEDIDDAIKTFKDGKAFDYVKKGEKTTNAILKSAVLQAVNTPQLLEIELPENGLQLFKKMQEETGIISRIEIIKEALSLFIWAVGEVKSGGKIYSKKKGWHTEYELPFVRRKNDR